MLELQGAPGAVLPLLVVALGAGVDFFLTVLVLGLTFELGLAEPQLEGFHPLHWVALTGTFGLYLLEALAELRRASAVLWHNLQLIVRPLAGAFLLFFLLDELPLGPRSMGALVGGIVCAFAHVLSWGRKFLFLLRPKGRMSPATSTLMEDLLVVVFIALAAPRPDLAGYLSLPLLLLGLFLGAPLRHAARFSFKTVGRRLLDPSGTTSWRVGTEIPVWVRRCVEDGGVFSREAGPAQEEALSRLRGTPAGLSGGPRLRGFREGWLVMESREVAFLYRHRRGTRSVPLDLPSFQEQEHLGWVQRVPLTLSGGGQSALFLQEELPGLKSHK